MITMQGFRKGLVSFGTFFLILVLLSASPNQAFAASKLRGVGLPATATAADITELAEDFPGINFIRMQISFYNPDNWTREEYLTNFTASLDNIENNLLPAAAANNIQVAIDFHSPCGGFVDRTVPNPELKLFADPVFKAYFLEDWQTILTRFASNATVKFYEPISEPPTPSKTKAMNTALEVAEMIRAQAPTAKIIIGPKYYDPKKFNDLKKIPKSLRKYVLYTFNFYQPHKFLHQGLPGGEAEGGVSWPTASSNAASIKKALKKVKDIAKKNKWQVFTAEFSTSRVGPGTSGADYLRAVLEGLESQKFNWSYHAWADDPVWGLNYTGTIANPVKATTPTDRMIIFAEFIAKNL